MKSIRKLSSTLFDAAGIVYFVFGLPAVLVIIVVIALIAGAVANVRKVRKQQHELDMVKRLLSEQSADNEKDE